MNLTNKQLELMVDEIFLQVSMPIIALNKKAIKEVELPKNDPWAVKIARMKELQNILDKANKEAEELEDQCKRKYKDVYFGYGNIGEFAKILEEARRKDLAIKLPYPIKKELETKIVLSGSKDLGQLLDEIVSAYNK